MCALLRSPRALSPRQRILALLDDLRDDFDLLNLDTIDGECYWRGCRIDLLHEVESLCGAEIKPELKDRFNHDDHEEPEEALVFLRQSLRHANALYAIEADASALYPRAVWRRLLEGERLAMRSAEGEVHTTRTGVTTLSLKIFSGAWRGAEVEAEVRRLDPNRTNWLEGRVKAGEPGEDVQLAMSFALASEARVARTGAEGEPLLAPYVVVTLPLPGPPPGVISREYDAIVCNDKGWHRALPGGGTRQEKEVALRAWTVALLMVDGMGFGEAMRMVCQRAGLAEAGQTRFNQDRQRLVARVPEAQAYLFVRKPVSLPRVKDRDVPIPGQPVHDDRAAAP